MIGGLRGKLLSKQATALLIDVNGIIYTVAASMQTLYRLPELGECVVLHTHLIVREDALLLYGFYDTRERDLFLDLLKVNGVGPKLALSILSAMDQDTFTQFVCDGNSLPLTRIPGVGKKTAERLIVEMRDRLLTRSTTEGIHISSTSHGEANHSLENEEFIVRRKTLQEAISALIALGYTPLEASRAVNSVQIENASSETLIREALKRTMRVC